MTLAEKIAQVIATKFKEKVGHRFAEKGKHPKTEAVFDALWEQFSDESDPDSPLNWILEREGEQGGTADLPLRREVWNEHLNHLDDDKEYNGVWVDGEEVSIDPDEGGVDFNDFPGHPPGLERVYAGDAAGDHPWAPPGEADFSSKEIQAHMGGVAEEIVEALREDGTIDDEMDSDEVLEAVQQSDEYYDKMYELSEEFIDERHTQEGREEILQNYMDEFAGEWSRALDEAVTDPEAGLVGGAAFGGGDADAEGAIFRTDDGYTLQWDGEMWTDGDMEFHGTEEGGPRDDIGQVDGSFTSGPQEGERRELEEGRRGTGGSDEELSKADVPGGEDLERALGAGEVQKGDEDAGDEDAAANDILSGIMEKHEAEGGNLGNMIEAAYEDVDDDLGSAMDRAQQELIDQGSLDIHASHMNYETENDYYRRVTATYPDDDEGDDELSREDVPGGDLQSQMDAKSDEMDAAETTEDYEARSAEWRALNQENIDAGGEDAAAWDPEAAIPGRDLGTDAEGGDDAYLSPGDDTDWATIADKLEEINEVESIIADPDKSPDEIGEAQGRLSGLESWLQENEPGYDDRKQAEAERRDGPLDEDAGSPGNERDIAWAMEQPENAPPGGEDAYPEGKGDEELQREDVPGGGIDLDLDEASDAADYHAELDEQIKSGTPASELATVPGDDDGPSLYHHSGGQEANDWLEDRMSTFIKDNNLEGANEEELMDGILHHGEHLEAMEDFVAAGFVRGPDGSPLTVDEFDDLDERDFEAYQESIEADIFTAAELMADVGAPGGDELSADDVPGAGGDESPGGRLQAAMGEVLKHAVGEGSDDLEFDREELQEALNGVPDDHPLAEAADGLIRSGPTHEMGGEVRPSVAAMTAQMALEESQGQEQEGDDEADPDREAMVRSGADEEVLAEYDEAVRREKAGEPTPGRDDRSYNERKADAEAEQQKRGRKPAQEQQKPTGKRKRCPKGSRKNPKTGQCEPYSGPKGGGGRRGGGGGGGVSSSGFPNQYRDGLAAYISNGIVQKFRDLVTQTFAPRSGYKFDPGNPGGWDRAQIQKKKDEAAQAARDLELTSTPPDPEAVEQAARNERLHLDLMAAASEFISAAEELDATDRPIEEWLGADDPADQRYEEAHPVFHDAFKAYKAEYGDDDPLTKALAPMAGMGINLESSRNIAKEAISDSGGQAYEGPRTIGADAMAKAAYESAWGKEKSDDAGGLGSDAGPSTPGDEAGPTHPDEVPHPGEEQRIDFFRKEYQAGRMSSEEVNEAMAPYVAKYGDGINAAILEREDERIDAEIYPAGKGSGRCPNGTRKDPKSGQCRPHSGGRMQATWGEHGPYLAANISKRFQAMIETVLG